jgi:hypothetical protein
MDNRTGKHSANGLRRTTVNIPVGGIKELFYGVFLLLLSVIEE